jgi:hypothetical protein
MRTTRKQHSSDDRTGNDFAKTRHGYSLAEKGVGRGFRRCGAKTPPDPFFRRSRITVIR